MAKNEFGQLLKKYLDGNCSKEERFFIDQWFDLPDDETTILQVDRDELETIRERLWSKIHAAQQTQAPIIPLRRYSRYVKWIVAASVIVAMLIVWLSYYQHTGMTSDEMYLAEKINEGMQEKVNTTTNPVTIQLEDSSIVTLMPKARFVYPKKFALKERIVYLEGEAFFEISKDKARPFMVYNKVTVTKVVGTSFFVRTNEKQVVVTVVTGKVAVYENKQINSIKQPVITITPNQQAVFNKYDKKFATALAENPVMVSMPGKKELLFNNSPLHKVLQDLGDAYNVHIVVKNNALNNCPFTGDVSDANLSLYQKLDIICLSINASYTIDHLDIVIAGKGCD
ncbi:FecR family protein [Danxiaibacter flavus]|uniref:FecR family protein n=1 Tax=Danxiaibacter flavus TaxID=3049108 RepID=A0ABV3ZEM2_9BACT|nr:FecR family protein [Chitinophagaceae bacterium DXS]